MMWRLWRLLGYEPTDISAAAAAAAAVAGRRQRRAQRRRQAGRLFSRQAATLMGTRRTLTRRRSSLSATLTAARRERLAAHPTAASQSMHRLLPPRGAALSAAPSLTPTRSGTTSSTSLRRCRRSAIGCSAPRPSKWRQRLRARSLATQARCGHRARGAAALWSLRRVALLRAWTEAAGAGSCRGGSATCLALSAGITILSRGCVRVSPSSRARCTRSAGGMPR
mmetsp:Transcript_17773/g.40727  ORF Transcript_17773/g.40727 Transcript_17773/m.40727 type:complete len:224 (-) Transcript_17773:352-1023(-)